jgi:hypothetical protein
MPQSAERDAALKNVHDAKMQLLEAMNSALSTVQGVHGDTSPMGTHGTSK